MRPQQELFFQPVGGQEMGYNQGHIFSNVKLTLNKNVHKFWHHFLAQFFVPFHMVWSILQLVLALKTTLKEASDHTVKLSCRFSNTARR